MNPPKSIFFHSLIFCVIEFSSKKAKVADLRGFFIYILVDLLFYSGKPLHEIYFSLTWGKPKLKNKFK